MLALQQILNSDDIQRIHHRSLEILEKVGIRYNTPRALEILEGKGCKVDYEQLWASIPPDLVEWAVQQTKREVLLGARDQSRDIVLDGNSTYHTTDSQGTRAIDLETGEMHDSNSEDLRRISLFGDALDMVSIGVAWENFIQAFCHPLNCISLFGLCIQVLWWRINT